MFLKLFSSKKRSVAAKTIASFPKEILCLYAVASAEKTGPVIAHDIARMTEKRVYIGALYPTLRRLEIDGLIESRWDDSRSLERRGARKRYYKITDAGLSVIWEVDAKLHGLQSAS